MKVGIVGCDYSSQMGTGLTEEMKSQIDDGVRHAAYRPDLSAEEHLGLQKSAHILKEAVVSLKMM
jgi:hypothetical protein